MHRAALAVVACIAAQSPVRAQVNVWMPLGPETEEMSPVSVQSVATSRTPPTLLYSSGLDSLFVATSSTSGAIWNRYPVPRRPNDPPASAFGIVVHPDDPMTAHLAAGFFIATTTNAGPDLAARFAPSCQFTRRLAIAPSAPQVLFAAGGFWTQGCVIDLPPGSYCPLVKSVDGGARWTCPISPPLFYLDRAAAIAIDPNVPEVVYVALDRVLVKSLDGGLSWHALPIPASEVAIDPLSPSTVIAATLEGQLWKSTDGGIAWSPLASVGRGPLEAPLLDVVPHPVDPSILYVGVQGHGIFASRDGGASFTPLDAGLGAVEVAGPLAIDSSEPSRLYAATDAGVFTMVHEEPVECSPDARTLCLGGGRFKVQTRWRDFQGRQGFGRAVPLTGDSGYFWFFSPDNLELVVKALDGRALNDRFWVFYGALSNVEFQLVVTDTETGEVKGYFNPSRHFASVGDTAAFPRADADAGLAGSFEPILMAASPAPSSPAAPLMTEIAPVAATGSSRTSARQDTDACAPDVVTLCLGEGRFRVRVLWRDFAGRTGDGHANALNETTGHYWFFNEANVELAIKVLDGRAINGHFWVFYGALSNVEYAITVEDTETGEERTYSNPLHTFASRGDTAAFPGS